MKDHIGLSTQLLKEARKEESRSRLNTPLCLASNKILLYIYQEFFYSVVIYSVFLDLEKAFDKLWLKSCILDLLTSGVRGKI